MSEFDCPLRGGGREKTGRSHMETQTVFVEVRAFKKGETIFREGEPGGCAYEIQSGRVAIVAGYGTERETILTELNEGAIFGEMGMVRGYPRSATAVALDPRTDVSIITWESIGRYFKEKPGKIIQIMQQMGMRIEALSGDYMDACAVISDLVEQRDELIQESKHRERVVAKLEEKLKRVGVSDGNEAEEHGVPVWKRLEGESLDEENKRFKKYLEAYRNFKKTRSRQ